MDKKSSRRDMLSSLPLSIIHIILSFVPIKDAIRTSFLSRQWRYIWCSLPHLAFDYRCVEDYSDEKRLVHFINQTLLLHKGPIHKFRLSISPLVLEDTDIDMKQFYYYQHIDQWLLFLSRSDIRILILKVYDDGPEFLQKVHSSLYSCQYLTNLELLFFEIPPPPPTFKGFLYLSSLYLNAVEVSSSTMESIIAHSPLLEELKLEKHTCLEMTIRAPNLKFFHWNYLCGNLSLCTPLLEKLKGEFYEIKHFSIVPLSFRGLFVFRHLRIIELRGVPFDKIDVTLAVIHLITGSPNLHKLEISGSSFRKDYDQKRDSVSFWDIECAPDFTYDSLKVIEMKYCGGKLNEMKLIKFLLARSPVLEKMIYKPYRLLPDKDFINLMAEMLSYRRASANAEILIGKN